MRLTGGAARDGAAANACVWMARFGVALLMSLAGVSHAQVSVGDSGTPSYSQAVAVPPGVAGMSPKLSVFYAGGGVNGPPGMAEASKAYRLSNGRLQNLATHSLPRIGSLPC